MGWYVLSRPWPPIAVLEIMISLYFWFQGASGQGIREHIAVKKKNDSLGIGKVGSSTFIAVLDRN